MKSFKTGLLVCALVGGGLVPPQTADAQSLFQSVLDNGSGPLANAAFRLRGSLGQPAAGQASNSIFIQQTGFWFVSAQLAVDPIHRIGSYTLLATHSMRLRTRAKVRSGFVGVNEVGQRPFLSNGVELALDAQVRTAASVEVSAANVRVGQKAKVEGTLHYLSTLEVGRKARVADPIQETVDFWPLVRLPAFLTGTPGGADVEVEKRETEALAPGAYRDVRVRQKGTLIFAGGRYEVRSFEARSHSKVFFQGPTILLVAGSFEVDQKSTFGPEEGAPIDASDILVYVEGIERKGARKGGEDDDEDDDENDNDEDDGDEDDGDEDAGDEDDAKEKPATRRQVVKVGAHSRISANLFALGGLMRLGQKVVATGAFIGRHVLVEERAEIHQESGWSGAGSLPIAASKLVLAKPVSMAGADEPVEVYAFGVGQNYPNPFNLSTSIRYTLSELVQVKLTVYNLLGQEVQVLVDATQVAGAYHVTWDGRNAMSQPVASGLYLYRLETEQEVAVRRMIVVK